MGGEVGAGGVGRGLGFGVPELVPVRVRPALARGEPDEEIQDLLERSAGLNLGLDFLPGSLAYAPGAGVDAALAAEVVWFDAYASNVDRTPRNPNLLLWHGRLWLIDHGAALYRHHAWTDPPSLAAGRFPAIRDHVLLPAAGPLPEADARLAGRLPEERLRAIAEAIPDGWLEGQPPFATPAEHRDGYVAYLTRRLVGPRPFVEEAEDARRALAAR